MQHVILNEAQRSEGSHGMSDFGLTTHEIPATADLRLHSAFIAASHQRMLRSG
jgi:hypothetical protein